MFVSLIDEDEKCDLASDKLAEVVPPDNGSSVPPSQSASKTSRVGTIKLPLSVKPKGRPRQYGKTVTNVWPKGKRFFHDVA
jgi:hypothetical protein